MTAPTVHTLDPATAPIDSTGRERHDVSLLVVGGSAAVDTRFRNLGNHLNAGDVLVANTSATEPAALDGRTPHSELHVHISGPGRNGRWIVELRQTDRSGPVLDARPGERIDLGDDFRLILREPAHRTADGVRLWQADWSGRTDLISHVRRHGRPIRYSYVPEQWPRAAYRTVFERRTSAFSSAEMPSAARPFTETVLRDLENKGIEIATVTLHTGVSSPEWHEPPMPERFNVSKRTARAIERARSRGNRVIAIGTTTARAIESAVEGDAVTAVGGWTDRVLSPAQPARVIDGIISGWHPPEASHLLLLQSIAGDRSVELAYEAAAQLGYRSHEFGDSCLLLGQSSARSGRRARVRASR